MSIRLAGHLDAWGHRLHLPGVLQRPLCYLMDRACGLTKTEARS